MGYQININIKENLMLLFYIIGQNSYFFNVIDWRFLKAFFFSSFEIKEIYWIDFVYSIAHYHLYINK